MEFQLIQSPFGALAALLTGIAFGFLLRKSTVSRFDTIAGQLILKDFTVMKVMLTAIVVGSIGIYSLDAWHGIPKMHLSETPVLFTLIGGAIFGVGMSIAGYCPGTAVAALGEGSKDMVAGIAGMLFGAALFNELSPVLTPYLQEKDFAFKQTFATYLDLPIWTVIGVLVLVWTVFYLAVKILEKR